MPDQHESIAIVTDNVLMQAFKQLLWKEWRQNGIYAALAILTQLVSVQYIFIDYGRTTFEDYAAPKAFFFFALPSLVYGASMISNETRHETIKLLVLLPVSRSIVWFAKATTGVGIVLLSTAVHIIDSFIYVYATGQTASLTTENVFGSMAWNIMSMAFNFGVGLLVSNYIENFIVSMIFGLCMSFVGYIFLFSLSFVTGVSVAFELAVVLAYLFGPLMLSYSSFLAIKPWKLRRVLQPAS